MRTSSKNKKNLLIACFIIFLVSVYIAYKLLNRPATTDKELYDRPYSKEINQPHNVIKPRTKQVLNFQLPHSLRGTDIRDNIQINPDGSLKVTKDVKDLFEYFLSAVGNEYPIETVLEMIRDYVNTNLPQPADEQTLALLEDYMDYKYSLKTLDEQSELLYLENGQKDIFSDAGFSAVNEYLELRKELRREHLSEEATSAFFRLEEAYENYNLEKFKAFENEELSNEQLKERISEIEAELPDELKKYREETYITRELNDILKSDDKGLTPEKIKQIEDINPDAASRFKALEQKRQNWNNKRENYLKAIQNADVIDQAWYEKIKYQLQLNDAELKRMQALDSLETSKKN